MQIIGKLPNPYWPKITDFSQGGTGLLYNASSKIGGVETWRGGNMVGRSSDPRWGHFIFLLLQFIKMLWDDLISDQ